MLRRMLPVLGGLLFGSAVFVAGVLADNDQMGQPSTIPVAWEAPPGVIKLSDCVPNMGEHWANPAGMPLGPIYTVYGGRLISIEYMLSQADIAAGKSWTDLKFLYWGKELTIQHADIEFQPQGHGGYEIPHHDLHFHLVSHDTDRAISC